MRISYIIFFLFAVCSIHACYQESYQFDTGSHMPVVRHHGPELSMDLALESRLISTPLTQTLAVPLTAIKGAWGMRYVWRLSDHTSFALKRNLKTNKLSLVFFKEGCRVNKIHQVVIDPGHGGKDPGSQRHQLLEKEITLRYARALRSKLRALGRYEVHLTRAQDRFVSLAERVAVAERLGADLFISLHADAFEDPEVGGVSIYTLSPDGASSRLAEHLAGSDAGLAGIRDSLKRQQSLWGMVFDIQQRQTIQKSLILARRIKEAFEKQQIPIHGGKVDQAGFVVLSSIGVPSVLVELGYLSHPKDVKRMQSPEGQKETIAALVEAIDHYCLNTYTTEGNYEAD